MIDHEIIIIGAGISGIGSAIMLNKEGYKDLAILERSNDIGGTWRDNRYPGIAVDIPSFIYQYSFEPNPRWSRMYAQGQEIYEYIHHCAKKYDVNKLIRFNSTVDKAVFNKENNTWTIYLTDGQKLTSRYIIAATGVLYNPIIPTIKGQDSFKGEARHTIKWDDNFDVKNKRVGIIGTGATAVQVVPAIAPDVKQLTVFQRTPIWLAPKQDYVFSKEKINEWISSPLKYKRKQFRTALWVQGATWSIQNYKYIKSFYHKYAEQAPLHNLHKQVKDPELRKQLTPAYAMGCKRPAISSDYFKTFTRDNVSLVTEGIACITEKGVLTKRGQEIPLDVIIYSTGFKTTEKGNFPNFKVYGTIPDELSDFWDNNKYQSYERVSIPGFPNFFLTSGPFSFGLNWFSMLEDNLYLIIRILNKAKQKKATFVDVDPKAHENHYKILQKRASNSVQVSSSCSKSNSYYIDRNGEFSLGAVYTPLYRWIKVRLMGLGGYQFRQGIQK